MPVLTQPKPPVAGERPPAGVIVQPMSNGDQLRNNLMIADRMVQMVGRYITVGATNRAEDWDRRGAELLITAASERFSGRSLRRQFGLSHYADRLEELRDVADAAIRSGCGNCGEQAAIGFVELYDAGVRPINYMEIATGGDHAFLIIGIASKEAAAAGIPENWGPEAVVCDPWGKVFYPAADIRKIRGGGETYSSYLRAGVGG